MRKIIVTGHGHFATGMQSAMELLAGKNATSFYVDFPEGMSAEQLLAELERIALETPGDDILFFTDLEGGTPFKNAAQIAYEKPNMAVAAGCNLGSLLDLTLGVEKPAQEQVKDLVITSRGATTYFGEREKRNNQPAEDEDGI